MELEEKKNKADKEAQPPSLKRTWWKQHWVSLNPFVSGGIAGLLTTFFYDVPWKSLLSPPTTLHFPKDPKLQYLYIQTQMVPGMALINTLAMSQTLGLFEILRRKVIATNDGMPPTLYQEVACGLTAGAVGAWMKLALFRPIYRYTVGAIGPVAESWRIRGHPLKVQELLRHPYLKTITGFNMGMLASYNPSLHYLRDSCGFSESSAIEGAALISTSFAVACSVPLERASSLESALKNLKLRGPLAFFTRFSGALLYEAARVWITWGVFEGIKKLELPNEL